MSLEDEIKSLRAKRESERQAELAEEQDRLMAQLTPESIAKKLTQLQIENPVLTEAVSVLQKINTPVLLSEVAAYLGLQPAVRVAPPSALLGLLGKEREWESPLGKIIRKETYTPQIEIYTGEEDGKCTYLSIGCVQKIRKVTLLGGNELPKDHSRDIRIVAVPQESSWKIRVGGFELEPTEDLLREVIVSMFADLEV